MSIAWEWPKTQRYALIDEELGMSFMERWMTEEEADERNSELRDCVFGPRWFRWPEIGEA